MKEFLQKYLWLVALVVGGIGALLIWFCLPHQSQIDEAWWLIVKFLIYFIAVLPTSLVNEALRTATVHSMVVYEDIVVEISLKGHRPTAFLLTT